MVARIVSAVVAAACAALVGGCANERSSSPALATGSAAAALPAAGPIPKTMSSRVLAAIALERVTGLKPDPGRLVAPN